jgi:hypothetical protein
VVSDFIPDFGAGTPNSSTRQAPVGPNDIWPDCPDERPVPVIGDVADAPVWRSILRAMM